MVRVKNFYARFRFLLIFNFLCLRAVLQFVHGVLFVFIPSRFFVKRGSKRIWIFGWYGTETFGDKLILLGILSNLLLDNEADNISICSMDKGITQDTVNELLELVQHERKLCGLIESRVSVYGRSSFFRFSRGDELILGGGPILHDPILFFWCLAVWFSKLIGVHTLIMGSGVGPLKTKMDLLLGRKILTHAKGVYLRGDEGYPKVTSGFRHGFCPSFIGVAMLRPPSKSLDQRCGGVLGVNVRQIPPNYTSNFRSDNEDFKSRLVDLLVALIINNGFDKVNLFSTHESDGVTDLEFGSEILSAVRLRVPFDFEFELFGPDGHALLNAIDGSDSIISTRYHGALMSLARGVPTAGLDYTEGGGKVQALFESLGCEDAVQSVFSMQANSSVQFMNLSEEYIGIVLDDLRSGLRQVRSEYE